MHDPHIDSASQYILQGREEARVDFNSNYLSSSPGKVARQAAQSRPDLQHMLGWLYIAGRDDLLQATLVNEEILPQAFIRANAVLF